MAWQISLTLIILGLASIISSITACIRHRDLQRQINHIDAYAQSDLEVLYGEVWELKRKERQRKE